MVKSIKELVTSKKELVNSLELVTSLQSKLTNLEIRVRVIEIAGELACLTYPNDLTGWYCKCYKTLGESKFCAICTMARAGSKPRNLFGWLLKQEMMKAILK